MQLSRVRRKQWAMLEHELRELAQVHRRQAVGVQRADEVFVEPLCFFDLEAYSLDREQFFLGQVDDEANAQIVEPVNERHLGICDSHVGRCRAACSGHSWTVARRGDGRAAVRVAGCSWLSAGVLLVNGDRRALPHGKNVEECSQHVRGGF